nr:hypothetical protein [Haloferax sp. BAB-2207]
MIDGTSQANLLISVLAGTLTALFSIVVTFHFYTKRDTIRSIRALQAEVEENENFAQNLEKYLKDDLEFAKSNQERTDSPGKFYTSAFDSTLNSGVLMNISPESRTDILNHYQTVEQMNSQLEYRSRLRAGPARSMSGYKAKSVGLNKLVMGLLQTTVSSEFRDEAAELSNEQSMSTVENALSPHTAITFAEISETLESELDAYPVLRHIV